MTDRPRFEFIGTPSERARSGAKLGAIMATAFSLYVFALYLLRGNAPFEKLDTTPWATVLMYYVAGFIAARSSGLYGRCGAHEWAMVPLQVSAPS